MNNTNNGDLAAELDATADAAREEIREKWILFSGTVHFKDDVCLAQKIALFLVPIRQFVEAKYPMLLKAPTEVLALTVFTAILESGTHSPDEVNTAIAQLRKANRNRFNKLTAPLNSPLKRTGALVLAIGIALIFVGVIELSANSYNMRDFFEKWVDSLRIDYTYSYSHFAKWGSYLFITGLLSSYLYDRTIGRIFAWVRSGK